jgi:hypothetical protein
MFMHVLPCIEPLHVRAAVPAAAIASASDVDDQSLYYQMNLIQWCASRDYATEHLGSAIIILFSMDYKGFGLQIDF